MTGTILFPYAPAETTVHVDGRVLDVIPGEFREGFRVDPVGYAGETELKWLVSFMVMRTSTPESHGHRSSHGLSEARITEPTIRAVIEAFYQVAYMREGREVSLIMGRKDLPGGFRALGNPNTGLAVAFWDHLG